MVRVVSTKNFAQLVKLTLCFSIVSAVYFALTAFNPATRVVDKSEIHIDPATGLRTYDGVPYTGDYVSYYTSGEQFERDQLKNGRWHGTKTRWLIDGSVHSISQYENGIPHGQHTSWWPDGSLRSEASYWNGAFHGQVLQWYESGQIYKKQNYEYGKIVGMQQAWTESGKLAGNFEMKNGRVYGLNRGLGCFGVRDEKLTENY